MFSKSIYLDRTQLVEEKNQLLRDLEEINRNMEENLNRHKAMVEANGDAKLQTIIQEQVARARLEWLKEKTSGQVDDLVHVEKSLGKQILYFWNKNFKTLFYFSLHQESYKVYENQWMRCVTRETSCKMN